MTIKQHGIILGAFAISLLGAPIRAEKSVKTVTENNKIASGAQLATAIAILPAVVAANWADLNKDLKGTKKATVLKVLADAVRAANAISSLYNFNNSFYSNKYKIGLAAFDTEQLVVDLVALWELFGSPKVTASSTPADSATTLTEAQLDKHLSTLSYSLRVVVLPLVEMGAAVYTASTPNPSDPKSLKWDACVHSLRTLSRLTSDYLVVKKASVQEKLYLAGILCNVCLLAYDFFTVEKKQEEKRQKDAFANLGEGHKDMGKLFKKEEPKKEEPKKQFKANQEELKKQQELDKKEELKNQEPKKQFKKEEEFNKEQKEQAYKERQARLKVIYNEQQEELKKQQELDKKEEPKNQELKKEFKKEEELKKAQKEQDHKERQARLKVIYNKQQEEKKETKIETTTTTPAPIVTTPAPIVTTPAPVVNTPAPVVNTPAPIVNTPAPIVNTPAPIVNTPAPIVNTPAPIVNTPAPVVNDKPQPAEIPVNEKPTPEKNNTSLHNN